MRGNRGVMVVIPWCVCLWDRLPGPGQVGCLEMAGICSSP